VSASSSVPRGEHAPRPGARWETELQWTGEEHLVPDDAEPPRPNRATRRAAARHNRRKRSR
jgi:hypothetical protein